MQRAPLFSVITPFLNVVAAGVKLTRSPVES